MNVEEFILAIQERPLMYVESVRIDYIFYLLKGYVGSNLVYKDDIDVAFHSRFYLWVLNWANENTDKKFEMDEGFYWHNILTEISFDEKEAVELFFKLSKEFFDKCKKDN